jgi:hypothetical protein
MPPSFNLDGIAIVTQLTIAAVGKVYVVQTDLIAVVTKRLTAYRLIVVLCGIMMAFPQKMTTLLREHCSIHPR